MQYTEPVVTDPPQCWQRLTGFGIDGMFDTRLLALTSLRRAWVSLVGRLNLDRVS
jgi:hypothetical protein